MKCQIEKNEYFLHNLFFEFNSGTKASDAVRVICIVYGKNAIGESTAQKWYVCFRCGFFT